MPGAQCSRRTFLKTAGMGMMALLGTPNLLYSLQKRDEKLNFVFIVADDLGWTDLSGYGSDLHETPNLDKLAEQGMKFTNAYAAAPICSPTRASLMTGKYPARLHITTWYENSGEPDPNSRRKLLSPTTKGNLPLNEVTIAEVLKDAGYFTAHVGKWHLGDVEHFPQTQGFDINIGGTHWGAPETYWYPYRGFHNQDEYRYIPDLETLELKSGENAYLTDRLTDEALKIMDKVNNRPFFLNMSYHTVHTPIEGKPELVEYYKKKVKPEMNHKNYIYAAMVASLDENVGRILDKINELGIAERTVVFFFSDNGGRVGSYGEWDTVANNFPLRSGKGSLYEGGIREPLIVRLPGVIEPGSICDFPVISNDFYPTIMHMTGVEGDEQHNVDMDALSLVPLLRNPDAALDRKTLYWHSPHYYSTTTPVSAIRHGKWKLLHYFDDDHLELYNLEEDLGEQQDLAEKNQEKTQELHQMLRKWRKDVGAQLPKPNPNYVSDRW